MDTRIVSIRDAKEILGLFSVSRGCGMEEVFDEKHSQQMSGPVFVRH